MNHVSTIRIENLQHKVRISRSKIEKIVLAVLRRLKAGKNAQVNVYFVSDKKIRQLNAKYLNESGATDVISFDISSKFLGVLADIFISADTARCNAGKFNTTVDYELCLYAAHGVLHLLGFDDTTDAKRRVMRRMENQIMEKNYGNL